MTPHSAIKNKLIIVDDNPVNLDVLLALLGEEYDLRVAIDGVTALDLIATKFEPDLVLLDVMMPGMNGYEVCQRLKSNVSTENIPIIFLTSLNAKEDEEKGLLLGAVDYITKPFNPAIVRRRIQTQLQLKLRQDELRLQVDLQTQKLNNSLRTIQAKEHQLQKILSIAPAGIGLVIERKIKWINKRMSEMVGYSSAELEGQSARLLYVSDEEFDWVGDERHKQISKHGTGTVDTRFVTKTGELIDIELNSTPLNQADLTQGVIFTAIDITHRKQTERILSARVHLLEFSENHSVDELLQEILDEAEKITGSSIGFFHFVEPDQETLSLQAWSTNTLNKMCKTTGNKSHYPISAAGVWVDAVQQKKTVVHNDYAALENKKGLPEGHVPVVRELIVPIFRANKVVALIGIGNKSTDYTTSDVKLAERFADMAWTIVEYQKTVIQLRHSEQKCHQLFNNMNSGIALYTATEDGQDFLVDDMNTAAIEATQVDLQTVVGKKVTEVFPGITDMGLLSVLQQVWKTGIAETLPNTRYQDKKLKFWVENHVSKLPSGQLAVIFDDISERKQIEAEIIQSKEEWENTFDSMVDIVTIQNSNLEIVRANKAAHLFFAAEYGNLNGKKCHEIFQGIKEPCTGCPLLDTLNDQDTHTEVMTHSHLGKVFQVTSSALKSTEGKTDLLVHVARDITEQTQLEVEAQRSQRLASLGELAAGVAHEINNPNGSIIYNSEIVRDVFKDLSPYLQKVTPENGHQQFGGLSFSEIIHDVPALLTDTYEAAQRIKRIVTDLRDFSRYDDSGSTEAVSLPDVVRSACRLAGNTIKKATNHFVLDLDASLPPIDGVSSRLEQVVLNLLLNACQALPDAEKKLSVSTRYHDDLNEVWLTVADEGVGIPAEILQTITDPFVTTKREQGGTGLGLSVSARIVKEHQGKLSFESTLGEGTQVTLKLPVKGGLKNEC